MAHAWQPVASLPSVPNYASFPHDPADGSLAAPRASVYVMTTEYKPRPEWPALVPLYLMDKDLPGTRDVDDFMLVTTKADIEYAHNLGYNLRAIQGYIYSAPCASEPGCIPPGAERFYRACNASATDCATFLESESASFAAAGYTTTFPPIGGTKTLLGYAYSATDGDHDGLPDGFEYVVGTSPTRADSDGDGLLDAYEFPMTGVPTSDPCAGGIGAHYCGADVIFRNGFDVLQE
jgi:serine protease